MTGDAAFHLVALSKNRVRLFSGTRDALTELPLGPIPASLQDMERRQQREPELQHQHEPPASGTATFHGHGGADISDIALEHFILEVATGIRSRLGTATSAPIVLAAVAEYLPMLRATGALPTLAEEPVPGNPDEASAADLHARAWRVVESIAAARSEQQFANASEWLGTGRGIADLAEIHAAAHAGRVDTLLVRPDATADNVPEGDQSQARLLDGAICAALRTGTTLRPASRLPNDAAAVALLRY